METVALHPGIPNLPRERDQVRNGGMAAVKAGVEASDLRHVRQTLEDRFDGGEVVRLMERSQRDQLVELLQDLPGHDHRSGVARPSVDDAMADPENPRAAVLRSKPGGERVECVLPIAHRRIQLLIGQSLARGILDGESRRRSDALDLSPRFEPPALGRRPPVHAELQARGARVQNESVVIHSAPSESSPARRRRDPVSGRSPCCRASPRGSSTRSPPSRLRGPFGRRRDAGVHFGGGPRPSA